jgi:hypothetical protein
MAKFTVKVLLNNPSTPSVQIDADAVDVATDGTLHLTLDADSTSPAQEIGRFVPNAWAGYLLYPPPMVAATSGPITVNAAEIEAP